MTRNKSFQPNRAPFRDEQRDLRLKSTTIHGPFSFLNPTRAHFQHEGFHKQKNPVGSENSISSTKDVEEKSNGSEEPAAAVGFLWRSRDNRKGRHTLLVRRPIDGEPAPFLTPRRTSHPREILKNILRMFTYFPYWDISWLVAIIFTWGSIVWVINGFFSFLPLIRPSSEFHNEILYGGGITAFIGAVVFFEFGSILLMFEAVNENNPGCFGWALENLIADDGEKHAGKVHVRPIRSHCSHHHQNKNNFVGKSSSNTVDKLRPDDENTKDGKTWQWFPSKQALKTHYLHELGFLASFAQFCGATIFSIAGITALPGINNKLSQGALDGIYWVPQVIGGSGFIISGTLYLLESQKNWYTPAPRVLGWHIAFWNLIGGWGFTLCGALGMAYGNSGAEYQAACSTFWGSFAFLIGSVLQWYESLDKHPVEEMPESSQQSKSST